MPETCVATASIAVWAAATGSPSVGTWIVNDPGLESSVNVTSYTSIRLSDASGTWSAVTLVTVKPAMRPHSLAVSGDSIRSTGRFHDPFVRLRPGVGERSHPARPRPHRVGPLSAPGADRLARREN